MTDWPAWAATIAVGVAAIALGTLVALRLSPPPGPVDGRRGRGRGRGFAPAVPWLGSVLVLVLLIRGSYLAAGMALLATIAAASVVRWRRTRPDG